MALLSITKGLPKTITPEYQHRLFEAQVNADTSDKKAIIFDNCGDTAVKEELITYKALNKKANKFANTILNMSIPKEANQDEDWIICIYMNHSINLIATILAVWKAGAAYLPLEQTFPTERVEFILNEANPFLIIYDDVFEDRTKIFGKIPKISISRLEKDSEWESIDNISKESTLNKESSDIALICYTSGSTGPPRGVRLTHSSMNNRFNWQWETFPYSNSENYLLFKTAFSFIDSVAEIWCPLLKRKTLIIIPIANVQKPEKMVAILKKYKIERVTLVPSILQSILVHLIHLHEKKGLPHLKKTICSGELLTLALAKEFFNYFKDDKHELYNFYGSTELMGDISYHMMSNKSQLQSLPSVPIGKPIQNAMLYVLDSDFKPVKQGLIGELFAADYGLTPGYVNGRCPDRLIVNPFSIDRAFSRLFRTGDFASMKENNIIYYEGRTDSQVKVRGHHVDLKEIEIFISKYPIVHEVAVLCYHPREIDQVIVAFVILKNKYRNTKGVKDIEEYMKTKLMGHMKPEIAIVEEFKYTISGKLDRQYLLECYANCKRETNIVFDYTDVPPSRMEAAKDLFEIIAKVIGYSSPVKISLTSNFFELGGTSLNTMITIIELKKKGYTISITSFIAAKNVGMLLSRICTSVQPHVLDIDRIVDDLKEETDIEFFVEKFSDGKKLDIINLIANSLYEKSILAQFIKPKLSKECYPEVINAMWPDAVKQELSFLIKDSNERIVGISVNFDLRNEPDLIITNPLMVIFEFYEFLEKNIRDRLPGGLNQVFHSFLIVAHPDLTPQENVALVLYIEGATIKLAIERKFSYILTTNTAPITQLIALELGYRTFKDAALNDFVRRDSSKPFEDAPESMRAIVAMKTLDEV